MRTLKTMEAKQHGTDTFPCGFYAVDKDYPTFHMPLHWHTEFEIILVRTGRFHLTLNGVSHRLYAGDMAFIGGGVLHGGSPEGNDCVYDCAVFDLSLLSRSIEDPIITGIMRDHLSIKSILSFTDSRTTWEAVVRLMDSLKNQQTEADRFICLGVLYEVFGRVIGSGLYGENTEDPGDDIRRWKKLLYYIEEHYPEKITLEMLADVAGLSPKYLCRAFARLTGKTPLAYLNEYRLDCACEMLRNTDETILSIAMSCGFNDQSYFVKHFRQSRGLTPGAYRKQEK